MENHLARVVSIKQIEKIEGLDNLVRASVLGTEVLVGKDAKVGDIGVFFDGELQLSHEYVKENNLYRDASQNKDTEKSGYFEANRRVKLRKFKGVASHGLFMPLQSLAFTGKVNFNEGDSFNKVGGIEICKKFMIMKSATQGSGKPKKIQLTQAPSFKEHFDTPQFWHSLKEIRTGDVISVTAKLHGTSARQGLIPVKRINFGIDKVINKLANFKFKPIWRLYKYLSQKVQDLLQYASGTEIENLFLSENVELVVGTRRCVLFNENKDKESFHGKEDFRFKVAQSIPLEEGEVCYGEIIGYAGSSTIMPTHSTQALNDKKFTKKYGSSVNYTYGCKEGEFDFYAYRVTKTDKFGNHYELTYEELVKWCQDKGVKVVPLVHDQFIFDGNYDKLKELIENLTERNEVLTEDFLASNQISEGVVVRADREGQTKPIFLKNKSFAFKVMEGICKETQVDPEDEA